MTTYRGTLCSLSFVPVKSARVNRRQENRRHLAAGRRSRQRPPHALARPAVRLLTTDLDRVNAVIVDRMRNPVALIPQLAGHIVAGRQTPAASADSRRLTALRLSRRSACGDRRGGRVHPHRDPAARRCRRRQRAASRPRHGQCGVGQQAGGAGRRFSVQPVVRADGRGRLVARSRNPVARRGGDRRGRGTAADDGERHADDRGRLSRGHPGEDGRAVRRGEPHRRGARRAPAAKKRRSTGSAAISASPFSWSTTCSISRRVRAELGKSVGDDFRDGKVTCRSWSPLPAATRRSAGSGGARSKVDQQPGDLDRAIGLVERRGALAETLARARGYAAAAIDALDRFPTARCAGRSSTPPRSRRSAAS